MLVLLNIEEDAESIKFIIYLSIELAASASFLIMICVLPVQSRELVLLTMACEGF